MTLGKSKENNDWQAFTILMSQVLKSFIKNLFVTRLCIKLSMSDNSLRKTVHTHRASVRQAAKLVAALLRVARVNAGLAESNGSLQPGL